MQNFSGYFAKKPFKLFILKGIMVFCAINAVQITAASLEISYDDAIKMADSLNPQNRIYYSRISELMLKKQVLKSNFLPQIDGLLSYTRLEETPPGKKYLLGDSKNDIYGDITIKQLLFDGGKSHIENQINDKQTEVEIQNWDQLRRSIRVKVTRAWFEALKAKYGLKVQLDLIKRMQEQQSIAELLYSSGKVSNLDVLRIKTQILSAQGQLQTLKSAYSVRLFALAQAIGTTDSLFITDSEIYRLDTLQDSIIEFCSYDEAIQKAPEIKAAAALHEKSLVDQRMLKTEYFPTLSVKASMNLEDSKFFPQNPNWNAGLVLNVPVFKGGSVKAKMAQAKERTYQYLQGIESAKINFENNFRSALEVAKEKQQRISIAEQTFAAAMETNEAAELRYSSGKLSAFELIDAQITLYRTQQDIFNARVDFRIALEELKVMCSSELSHKEQIE